MSFFPRVRYLTPPSGKWKQWISSHTNSLKLILLLTHLLPGLLNYFFTSGSATNVLQASIYFYPLCYASRPSYPLLFERILLCGRINFNSVVSNTYWQLPVVQKVNNPAVCLPLSCTKTIVKEFRAHVRRKANVFVHWTPCKRDLWAKPCQNAWIIQSGAKRTHVFLKIITLFIFNIKKLC